jgi:hypothetical protein
LAQNLLTLSRTHFWVSFDIRDCARSCSKMPFGQVFFTLGTLFLLLCTTNKSILQKIIKYIYKDFQLKVVLWRVRKVRYQRV